MKKLVDTKRIWYKFCKKDIITAGGPNPLVLKVSVPILWALSSKVLPCVLRTIFLIIIL
jgi:hypothetical protein